MLEAARGRALLGRGIRIHGIDFDDPAEAVRLVRLLCEVEALVPLAPGVAIARHAITLVIAHLRMIVGKLAPEVAVDVLLAGYPSTPGSDAAGTIVEHAEHTLAGGIRVGLHSIMIGSGAS